MGNFKCSVHFSSDYRAWKTNLPVHIWFSKVLVITIMASHLHMYIDYILNIFFNMYRQKLSMGEILIPGKLQHGGSEENMFTNLCYFLTVEWTSQCLTFCEQWTCASSIAHQVHWKLYHLHRIKARLLNCALEATHGLLLFFGLKCWLKTKELQAVTTAAK